MRDWLRADQVEKTTFLVNLCGLVYQHTSRSEDNDGTFHGESLAVVGTSHPHGVRLRELCDLFQGERKAPAFYTALQRPAC